MTDEEEEEKDLHPLPLLLPLRAHTLRPVKVILATSLWRSSCRNVAAFVLPAENHCLCCYGRPPLTLMMRRGGGGPWQHDPHRRPRGCPDAARLRVSRDNKMVSGS